MHDLFDIVDQFLLFSYFLCFNQAHKKHDIKKSIARIWAHAKTTVILSVIIKHNDMLNLDYLFYTACVVLVVRHIAFKQMLK